MFDFMASQDIERLRRAMLDLTATASANVMILVEKGICTEEEWLATKTRIVAQMDQAMAAAREEKLAKLESLSPVAKALYEATGLDLSKPEE
jgi:hypothetical protein